MKLPFGFKIGLAITVLAVGVTSSSLAFFYINTRAMVLEQMGSRLEDIASTATNLFGEEEKIAIRKLNAQLLADPSGRKLVLPLMQQGRYAAALQPEESDKLMESAEFQALVKVLRKVKNATEREIIEADGTRTRRPTVAFATILTTIPESKDRTVLQFIADADYDKEGASNPIGNLFANNSDAIRNGFGGEVDADEDFREEDGQFLLSAGVPIFDAEKKVLGVLALDYDAHSEVNKVKQLFKVCVLTIVGALALSILVAMFVARLLNRPLRKLREGAERVRQRDYSATIQVSSRDELGLLATTFNSMVTEIKDYATGLENLNTAYYRFVPKQFLEQLGQKSIVDVKLGDQVQRQMTVLFSDIRSFTTISESMSPRENFEFINEYLQTVSPIIRAHGGFIDKYIGDAVMALFPESVDQALQAAIEMQKALIGFNERFKDSGRPPIKIGVGLHHGNLMLGTVGEELRMEGTVISDAVNLASRLEGLTKDYGAPIVVSERVIAAASSKMKFTSRYLGRVKVKGKRHSVQIFEIIDGELEELGRRKIVTTKDFERGVQAFEKGQIVSAMRSFRKVRRVNRCDVATGMYLEKCRKLRGDVVLDKEPSEKPEGEVSATEERPTKLFSVMQPKE